MRQGEDRLGLIMPRLNNLYWIDENELLRAEFLLFRPSDLQELKNYIDRKGKEFAFGIHMPLIWPPDYQGNPLQATLVDPDPKRRRATLDLLRENLGLANEWGAEYVLVHLQRPVNLLDGPESADPDPGAAFRILAGVIGQVEEMSVEARVPIILENMIAHPHLWRVEDYLRLCIDHPDLGFCLDIDHLNIDAQLHDFDFMEAFEKLAPHLYSVHLSNFRMAGQPLRSLDMETFRGMARKVPVHPEQDPARGWIDVMRLVQILAQRNPDCLIIFEAYPTQAPDEAYIWEGIQWIKSVYTEARSNYQ